jgi:hypothetical protein
VPARGLYLPRRHPADLAIAAFRRTWFTPPEIAHAALEAWREHLDGQWQDTYEPIRGTIRRLHFTAVRTTGDASVRIRVNADLDLAEEH